MCVKDSDLLELNIKNFPITVKIKENSGYGIYLRDRMYIDSDEYHVVYKKWEQEGKCRE